MRPQATRPLAIFACVVTVALAACGTTAAPSSSPPSSSGPTPAHTGTPAPTPGGATPSPSATAEAAVPLLRVTSEGGFINPASTLAALPTVVVYTDGRIVTPGAAASIAPAPLVSPVDVRDVGPAGAAAILAAIKQAGLDRPATGGPGIPGDSGTNVFTVIVNGATTTTRLAGGGPPGPGKPGGASGDPERTAALELLNRLLDPAETWGAASAPETPLAATAYRIFVAPGAPPSDTAAQPPVAWPLSTPLDGFGATAQPDRGISGLRVGVVSGTDATRLGPILLSATTETPFTSNGKSYTLYVRPLLPDELDG